MENDEVKDVRGGMIVSMGKPHQGAGDRFGGVSADSR